MNHVYAILEPAAAVALVSVAGYILKFMRNVDIRLTRIETMLQLPIEKRSKKL